MANRGRSRRQSLAIVAGLLVAVVLAALLFRATGPEPLARPGPAVTPTATSTAVLTPSAESTPPPTATPVVSLPAEAEGLEPAPLGAFVVARPGAGIVREASAGVDPFLDVPVYEAPEGPPQSLLAMSPVEPGRGVPINLVNSGESAGTVVLRLIAGGPDDDWLMVQAPTRPHDRFVWVKRLDFDFDYTPRRIEIDLAGPGELVLLGEEDEVLLRTGIVQGRDTRETPTHLTYIERGVLGAAVRPAYGHAVISMASFSEDLDTFGGGGLPSNFLHGTNQPQLMGQRVSSGEIRIPDDKLVKLIDLIRPGTPVLMFDSSGERSPRDQILKRVPVLAETVAFDDGFPAWGDATAGLYPRLWNRCTGEQITRAFELTGRAQLLCVNQNADADPDLIVFDPTSTLHTFAVAWPDAGADFGREPTAETEAVPAVIPVFDEPDGLARSLVYDNGIDNTTLDYPLFPITVFGEPLVLSVVAMTRDGEWLQVRAPVLPHNQTVWVRGSDFDVRTTTLRIEIDIGYEFVGQQGIMVVWGEYRELMAAKISSGREARPTTVTNTYVDQIIAGPALAPAYGAWLFSTPSFSETLGTFGGGGIPQQAIHGIHDELSDHLGRPMSSGSIHVSNETILEMADFDLLGAAVVIYDSRSRSTNLYAVQTMTLTPATTKPLENASLVAPVGSFT